MSMRSPSAKKTNQNLRTRDSNSGILNVKELFSQYVNIVMIWNWASSAPHLEYIDSHSDIYGVCNCPAITMYVHIISNRLRFQENFIFTNNLKSCTYFQDGSIFRYSSISVSLTFVNIQVSPILLLSISVLLDTSILEEPVFPLVVSINLSPLTL